MFREIQTKEDFKIFSKIWNRTAEEEGYTKELYLQDAIRYFLTHNNEIIGTIEFIKYQPEIYSTVEQDFSFSHLSVVKENKHTIWEIDKVCILKKHRRKGHVKNIFHTMAHHAESYDVSYYVTLIDNTFYKFLRLLTRYPLERVGTPFIAKGEQKKSVPCMLNAKESLIQFNKEMNLFQKIKF